MASAGQAPMQAPQPVQAAASMAGMGIARLLKLKLMAPASQDSPQLRQ